MNLDQANGIADAVLYEGHILYPYRPSARKNRVRWTFGGVHPRAYSEASGGVEACRVQAQFPVRGGTDAEYAVRLRFLHLVSRQVLDLEGQPVESITVDGSLYQTWEEATERVVEVRGSLAELIGPGGREVRVSLPGETGDEPIHAADGVAMGTLRRTRASLEAVVTLTATVPRDGVVVLTAAVANETPMAGAATAAREQAMRSSLVSTHLVVGVDGAEVVSLTDPPDDLEDLAAACQNIGLWPVLVGEADESDVVLASPIILEDHPRIAPESPGSLYDGLEIDEILTLRILTMTDDEKAEARAADDSIRALLDRTEALTAEDLARMHGTGRALHTGGPHL